MEKKKMSQELVRSLIVTIVKRGWGDIVLESAINSGASGATILFGRGMGIHEKQKLFGVCIEPEKEVVLCMVSRDIENTVLKEIIKRAELNKPGMGIAFIIPVEKVFGMVHMPE